MTDYSLIESAFSDDRIQAFYYDIFGKKLELFYEGYYDIRIKKYKEVPCVFVISDWKEAYSIPYDVEHKNFQRYDMDAHMGVFFMIMGMKYDTTTDVFEITINLIDESYCTYIFEQAKLSIVERGKY